MSKGCKLVEGWLYSGGMFSGKSQLVGLMHPPRFRQWARHRDDYKVNAVQAWR
jgi:hypothetical protein